MSITIRPGNENDYAAIHALIKEFAVFQKTPDKVTITIEQMIKEKDFFNCIVAEDSIGEIVGFASWFFAYYSWSGRAVYLDDLYVKASCRGQNTGTKLLESIIETARKMNCKKVRWQVSNWNKPAIAFYKKIGASIDDTEINCDFNLVHISG